MVAVMGTGRCQAFRVDGGAWRHPEAAWEPEELIEFAAAAATCGSPSNLVPTALAQMLPGNRVLAWAVIVIGSDGGIRLLSDGAPDSGLCARAVTWLWTPAATGDAFDHGAAYVETWHTEGGAEAIACLPLVRLSTTRGLIAVRLVAEDTEAIRRDVVRLTLLGRLWWSQQVSAQELDELGEPITDAKSADLTARQSLILRAMARGLTNAQIAHEINFSESTVRLESMSIYRHFGVHSRSDAVHAARAAGEL